MTLLIVGVGEPLAGDDGVALRVIERLRELELARPAALHALRDPSGICDLLGAVGDPNSERAFERVLIVDAVLDPENEGRVRLLGPEAFARGGSRPVSSHGMSALAAVELTRALYGERFPEVRFLTVSVRTPKRFDPELSESVASAVDTAIAHALSWIGDR